MKPLQRCLLGICFLSSLALPLAAQNRAGDADNNKTVAEMADAERTQAGLLGIVPPTLVSPLALVGTDSVVGIDDMMLISQRATGARAVLEPQTGVVTVTAPASVLLPHFAASMPRDFTVGSNSASAQMVDGLDGLTFLILEGMAVESTHSSPLLTVGAGMASVTLNPINPTLPDDVVTTQFSFDVENTAGVARETLYDQVADTVAAPVCGDGVLNAPGEVCDDGAGGQCNDDCLGLCGDGTVGLGEECDDGNNVDADGCQANCALFDCGDAIVDSANIHFGATLEWASLHCGTPSDLEVYVNGVPLFDVPILGSNCSCGLGYQTNSSPFPAGLSAFATGSNSITLRINPYEVSAVAWVILTLDTMAGPGEVILFDGYNPAGAAARDPQVCNFTYYPYSYDTIVPYNVSPVEQCDDGMDNGTCGHCTADCSGPFIPPCGNNIVECDEACDDGPGGVCFDDCASANVCGDGITFAGETCDDGANGNQCDGCTDACATTASLCGNMTLDCSEACDDGALNGQVFQCSGIPFYFSGHQYCIYSAPTLDYVSASSACQSEGGHLVTIADSAENNIALSSMLSAGLSIMWIGYDDLDLEGTFEWVTNEPTAQTFWLGGEPNDYPPGEDCTEMVGNGSWNDLPCSFARGYACEFPLGNCNGTCDGDPLKIAPGLWTSVSICAKVAPCHSRSLPCACPSPVSSICPAGCPT